VKTAVAYTRVSTAGQGRSGLGIEAQRQAVARFAEAEGYDLVQTFSEIETGRAPTHWSVGRSSRPPLPKLAG
jgi:DNA invertase Pin-like site-specific DNA recombinase